MFRKLVLSSLVVIVSCVAAQAQVSRAVLSGGAIELYHASSVNPDCTSAGRPMVRVTQAPEHGRVIVSNTPVFAYFSESNPRSACNRRRVPGVVVKYVSQRGYVGYDQTAFEIFYPMGRTARGSFSINVR